MIMDIVQANGMVIAAAALAVLLAVWWLLGRRRQSHRDRAYQPDVLDDGIGPAQRNQALIDAAPAALVQPPVPDQAPQGAAAPVAPASAAGNTAPAGAIATPPTAARQPDLPAVAGTAAVAQPPAGDDLARIKGLGPKLQALLPELGITTFAQIAALTETDLRDLDARLGPFAGRPARDGWVEQARYLAAGDVAGFEARFGKV